MPRCLPFCSPLQCIHANHPAFFPFIELIYKSVPILHEISPLCPTIWIQCVILFYCVPACPAFIIAQVGMYDDRGVAPVLKWSGQTVLFHRVYIGPRKKWSCHDRTNRTACYAYADVYIHFSYTLCRTEMCCNGGT